MGWREKNRPVAWGDRTVRWCGAKTHGGSYYRRPRTTQERRFWDPEFGRASRSLRRLPEAWGDNWARPTRSWKRHRPTQYKPLRERNDP